MTSYDMANNLCQALPHPRPSLASTEQGLADSKLPDMSSDASIPKKEKCKLRVDDVAGSNCQAVPQELLSLQRWHRCQPLH